MSPKSNRYFCLHAHFYQPPRENPWTGIIPPQPSAWPFENWNSRIARECYLPNACARISRSDGKPLRFINNYSYFNFNFGPTLLSWYEKAFPSYYRRLVEAGQESRRKCGHSSAIAQGYNHIIMPLASFQDRLTQAIWGIEDFKMRFGFMPEAMWLPEAAADDATMRLLIDMGLKYVILSPYQIQAIKEPGSAQWTDVSSGNFNTKRPYIWKDRHVSADGYAKERSIAVFVYDGPLSKAAAFEGLLNNSSVFADRIQGCFTDSAENGEDQLVTMAVDGETFGHHHKYAEMTLAYAFHKELKDRGIQVVNLGEYLELNPPKAEIKIKAGPDGEGTAWSCAHGVRRWKGGCPCGSENGDSTEWRKHLRNALNFLRDSAARLYAKHGAEYFKDPWAARNNALPVLFNVKENAIIRFFAENSPRPLTKDEQKKALSLLEMQKNAMFMFTSCGWFFSDVSRIETLQNLRYAARVCETMRAFDPDMPAAAETEFLNILAEAKSNYAAEGSAKDMFLRLVRENRKACEKAAAFNVAKEMFFDSPEAEAAETVSVKKRRNLGNTLAASGTTEISRGNEASPAAFAYLRKGQEFPKMFFAPLEKEKEFEKALDSGTPEQAESIISAVPGTVKITFDDFSPEEKNRYAWMLAIAVRDNHSAYTLSILNDYLYLLRQLPEHELNAWGPLKSQAANYARLAADIMLRKTARLTTENNIRSLANLAESIKEAGIQQALSPSPETALLLARKIASPVLEKPSLNNLALFHLAVKAARLLNAEHTLFHLQNYLHEIMKKADSIRNIPGMASLLEQIRKDAGLDTLIVEKQYSAAIKKEPELCAYR